MIAGDDCGPCPLRPSGDRSGEADAAALREALRRLPDGGILAEIRPRDDDG